MSKKYFEEKHVDLLLIEEEGKTTMFLSKILIHLCMITMTLHHGRKYFLQAFSTEKIWRCPVKGFFKINGKKMIKMPKKGKYSRFKNYERKIRSPFKIFADFENILVPQENWNPNGFYTNKYHNLRCVDD